ncbi:MAG TPA: DUF1080 domain-containing protein [Pirellulales bacterium]|nr:DUF1080 domain-containing protein [Pirellulales bacterium]
MKTSCGRGAIACFAIVWAIGWGLSEAAENHFASADPAINPFDGESMRGWTTATGLPIESGWDAADGVIHMKPGLPRPGNIFTTYEYGDFLLSFEWKIAPGGNSGIKYRVRSYGSKTLGCEYQIYDDVGAKRPPKPKNSAGALYDLYEPNGAKVLKPVGEYNTAKIVVRGNVIEHWLNGHRIVSATIGDAEWQRRIAESKFSDVENFAMNPRGKIMLTDHGSEVWLRNFKFEPADTTKVSAAR